MIQQFLKYSAFVVLLGLIGLTSCKHDRNHPGYAYMPDMYYSEPYNAYSENPVFNDGVTMRMPVPGTIPRGYEAYPYKPKSFEDQVLAGKELVNPVPVDAESLAEGKIHYQVYCTMCHGDLGKGDGFLYTSKKFPVKPTSLVEDYVQNKPDGEIYHVITMGSLSGLMGAHGSQIKPENRWKIINYVRELVKN